MESSGAFVAKAEPALQFSVWIHAGHHTMLNDSTVYNNGQTIGYWVYEATTQYHWDNCSYQFENLTYVSDFDLFEYVNYTY